MKRLLYIIENQIIVVHKQKNRIEQLCAYTDDTQGLEQFEDYLNQVVNIPISIMLDVIDEEFFHEQIPHLRGKDQLAVIKRNATRVLHNNHDHYYYKILGRVAKGSHHDQLFLSGVSNPELLKKILTQLHQHNIPVMGIWSLPLLTEQLFAQLKITADNCLLVSQQSPGSLRLSYFKNKSFHNSRLTTIYDEDLVHQVESEVEQTIKYLTNKREIGFNDTVTVIIISQQDNLQLFDAFLLPNPNINYVNHAIEELEKKLKIENAKLNNTTAIFSELCFRQHSSKAHYNSERETKSRQSHGLRKFMLVASTLCLLCSIVFAQYNWLQSERLIQQSERLQLQTKQIQQRYEQELLPLEEQFEHAVVIHSLSQLVDNIQQYRVINPLRFYLLLSKTLEQQQLQELRLSEINWHFNQLAEDSEQYPDDINIDSQQPQSVVSLSGQLPLRDNQYRQALQQLDFFVAALERHEQINKVSILQYPVDIRSDSHVGGNIDLNLPTENDNLVSFKLEIELKSPFTAISDGSSTETTESISTGELL